MEIKKWRFKKKTALAKGQYPMLHKLGYAELRTIQPLNRRPMTEVSTVLDQTNFKKTL